MNYQLLLAISITAIMAVRCIMHVIRLSMHMTMTIACAIAKKSYGKHEIVTLIDLLGWGLLVFCLLVLHCREVLFG